MKCRLHSSDLSSAVGVCASCLREHLALFISAQSQTHIHSEFQSHLSELDDRRNSGPLPHPPLTFPHSVSPYVTRRKFDDEKLDFSDRRFHSTPQIGAPSMEKMKTKRKSKFSFITNLFKARPDKSETDPRTASTSSPFWCPAGSTVPKLVSERIQNRGMSPERSSCDGEDSSSRSSPKWKQTPISSSSAAAAPTRRRHSNISGLAYCLSPLVRASPKRNSLPSESGGGDGGARKAAANSFCKNRSRKMADFGRGGRRV